MTDARSLNDDDYYHWYIREEPEKLYAGSDLPAGLVIESECCADTFSHDEGLVLVRALAEFYGLEFKEPNP